MEGRGVNQAQGPVFELVASVVFGFDGQGAGAFDVLGDAYHVVVGEVGAECVSEAAFHEGYGEVGDVYANPASVETFGDCDGCSASAEGVEYEVAFVAGSVDDAFEKGFGFLGWVAEAFFVGTR